MGKLYKLLHVTSFIAICSIYSKQHHTQQLADKDVGFATTGQQVVILSPGVGVYEVRGGARCMVKPTVKHVIRFMSQADQDLNRITKERVIDYGRTRP